MPSRSPTESERGLVSAAVQLAIVASRHMHGKTTEEVALWAAGQLHELGYHNRPVGAAWASLYEVEEG